MGWSDSRLYLIQEIIEKTRCVAYRLSICFWMLGGLTEIVNTALGINDSN